MRYTVAAGAAGLALVGLLLALVPRLLDDPSFIDRITIVNPTEYDLTIDATDAERQSWVSVAIAAKRSTTAAHDIIDQGEVWIFRFASQGEQAGELRVTRAELVAGKWTVRIPPRIGDELRAKGAPASP